MKTESCNTSTSQSRVFIPLQFVTSSNVDMPIELQKKLLHDSKERRALSVSIKANQDIEFRQERSKMITNISKDKIKTVSVKDYPFGLYGNKENTYATIHKKQRQLKFKVRDDHKEVLQCINKIKNIDRSLDRKIRKPPIRREMDSGEIEKRYKKITNRLDHMSKNIENAISSSTYV
ncbi:hypothetical protein SteCoe_11137 [Stentor coeruleus]|uniref:Enkurin domain-containing protein n=1 Tax=Stentor coeruleus TaxID=5963 RepID=A0A1R2CDX9_9CILI|nr:hypothetical protein SteCoe_11137 [Stentor coeruleus]